MLMITSQILKSTSFTIYQLPTFVTSNNVFKSLIDLSIGYYLQGGTLYA